MLQTLFEAPWPDAHDSPALVRARASQRIYRYWRSRGWQLVLGEAILAVSAYYREWPFRGSYPIIGGFVALAYLLGFFPRIAPLWLSATVGLLLVQGMLIDGLGAVTALSYMLPYTFAGMMLGGRTRLAVQAWCVLAFWISLLYELVSFLPQIAPPRVMVVSYNILLAAFTFQGLRFLNNLAVELNSTYMAEQVRGQSQHFLARVSHELRTPLNSVLGFAKLLRRGELTDKQSDYLRQIIDEGEHLNRLVSDLLDSAQLSTGKLTLQKEPCDVNALCEIVAAEQRPHLHPGVRLQLILNAELPPIMADNLRLRQIIANLLANAVKYTRQGHITLTTEMHGQSLLIHVADTGPGIPEAQQALVFVPFVQLDNRSAGVGLGLDIALQLARLHGGTIHLRSAPGQGSTFTLALPHASHKPL